MPRVTRNYVALYFSDTRKHMERRCVSRGCFKLDGVGADFGQRVQHPLTPIFGNIQEGDGVGRLRKHAREHAAHVVRFGPARKGSTDDDVPRHRGIEGRRRRYLETPIRHLCTRRCNVFEIRVGAADDVAVFVKGNEQLAAPAIDFEDTRAGTYIEDFGNVFCESEVAVTYRARQC